MHQKGIYLCKPKNKIMSSVNAPKMCYWRNKETGLCDMNEQACLAKKFLLVDPDDWATTKGFIEAASEYCRKVGWKEPS